MKYEPHNYQHHTTQFIINHPECAILLGMGMGKTISTLTAINELIRNRFQTRHALVIAPRQSRPRYVAGRNQKMGPP